MSICMSCPRSTSRSRTGVMVIKDEYDRIVITHEAASEPGEEAQKCLQPVQDLGFHVTAAFSGDSFRFTEAIKALWPQARFQVAHFHTGKNIWGNLKISLLSYRRRIKVRGETQQNKACIALAKQ